MRSGPPSYAALVLQRIAIRRMKYIYYFTTPFSLISLSDGDQFSPTLFFKLIFRNELGEHGRGGKEFNVDFLSLITSHARTLVPYTRTYNGEACQQNPNAVYLCHCAN